MLTEGRSSYIVAGSGQVNVIAVVALGPKFDLYVNKQYIDEVKDPNPGYYRDGTIGVVAKALDLYRPTEVALSQRRSVRSVRRVASHWWHAESRPASSKRREGRRSN